MQDLNRCVQIDRNQVGDVRTAQARRRSTAPRRLAIAFAALAFHLPLAATADSPDFRFRPLLAGKASLAEPGFVVRRELGVANFAPELRLPVELVYRSSSETSGAFGFAWRCPQLESSVRWSRDSLLWTTPWGEERDGFTRRHGGTENGLRLSERGAKHEDE